MVFNSGRYLAVTTGCKIPISELEFKFSRSSGPGGQNVNKVNSKAMLLWDVENTKSISQAVKQRFVFANRKRINKEGIFYISSDRYRDQDRNIEDCLAKFVEMLKLASQVPKLRKKSKPSLKVKEKRLVQKKVISQKKINRRKEKV